jgi:hypothetical protein
MILSDAHKRFKKLEFYSILKIFSYVFVVIGMLLALDIFFYLIGSEMRPLGEIYALISPDLVLETRPNSLYPVVVEGNRGLSLIIDSVVLVISFVGLGYFLIYMHCIYKTIKEDYTFKY